VLDGARGLARRRRVEPTTQQGTTSGSIQPSSPASRTSVVQVTANHHISAPNPRGEERSILLIGESDGGRLLTIPLVPTDDPTTWRPATAFDSSRHQRTVFRRRAR